MGRGVRSARRRRPRRRRRRRCQRCHRPPLSHRATSEPGGQRRRHHGAAGAVRPAPPLTRWHAHGRCVWRRRTSGSRRSIPNFSRRPRRSPAPSPRRRPMRACSLLQTGRIRGRRRTRASEIRSALRRAPRRHISAAAPGAVPGRAIISTSSRRHARRVEEEGEKTVGAMRKMVDKAEKEAEEAHAYAASKQARADARATIPWRETTLRSPPSPPGRRRTSS